MPLVLVLGTIIFLIVAVMLSLFIAVRSKNPNRKLPLDDKWESSYDAIKNMRIGWNLGNTLDAFNNEPNENSGSTPYDYETAWGNPITTADMIKAVKGAGFGAVRVPVTWYEHLDENNNIDEAWLNRVNEIVDYVIDERLYCIINVHHDTGEKGWPRASYKDFDVKSTRFVKIWQQICERFKDYDEKLLFEGFNGMLNDDGNWSHPGDDAFKVIDRYNQLFVDTVRESSGNNEHRNLIVATYACSSAPNQINNFRLPKDRYQNHLIVTVHNYSPMQFTVSEADWMETSDKITFSNKIVTSMEYLYFAAYFKFLNVPLIVGEFGSTWKDNPDESCEYASFIVRLMSSHNMTGFYWDDGGMYRLLDREKLEWVRPGFVEAMMKEIGQHRHAV